MSNDEPLLQLVTASLAYRATHQREDLRLVAQLTSEVIAEVESGARDLSDVLAKLVTAMTLAFSCACEEAQVDPANYWQRLVMQLAAAPPDGEP